MHGRLRRKIHVALGRAARAHHAWMLPLARASVNAATVTFALTHAGQPLPAALAQAGAAGLQSAFLQWSPVNQRYARYLNAAESEPARFARWAAVSSCYCAAMQSAGALVMQTGFDPGLTILLALRTAALGAAQYPWVAAIALRRQRDERRSDRCPQRVRFTADVKTMAVSATFVSLSALGAIGGGAVRLVLAAAGIVGLLGYLSLKHRRRSIWGRLTAIAAEASSVTMRAIDG